MSNVSISNLPSVTSAQASSQVPAVQAGTTVYLTVDQIAKYTQTTYPITGITSITAQSPLSGGTITSSGTIGLTTSSITNSYLANMPANTIKGNNTGSSTNPTDLTVAQTMTLLGAASLDSPTFTGTPRAPTPATSDSGTTLATTAFVKSLNYAFNSVTISAGTGLTGGGDLTANRTLSLASIANNTLLANVSGVSAAPTPNSLSLVMDAAFTSTQGSILYRGASNWVALSPGTNGQVLQTGGPSANPSWLTVTGAGTVTSIGAGTGLSSSSTNPITAAGTLSISNTGVTAGSYGSASTVPNYTVNAQGQLTAAASTSIAISATQVTSGVLAIAQGGTGLSALGTGVQTALGQNVTGSGGIVLATSPTLVTPTLGVASATSVAMTTGTISTTPSNATDIANKSYVDAAVSNVNYHAACNYGTTADLGTVTYNNGSSGVGATITKTSPFATLSIDGGSPSVGQRILVKNETSGQYNGIYTVTSVGSGSVGWVLTRATDYDQVGSGVNEIAPGDTTFIVSGTVNAGTQWVQTTDFPITIGTTPITFVQIGGPGVYSAGTGLTLSGNVFSITNTAVTATSYGSSTAIPTFTVNAQGQLTAASTAAVIAPAGTLTGTTLASNVVSSSLTSVGTIATGVWNGTTIATGYGGTGLTTFTSGGAVYATSSSALTTGTLPIASGGTGQTTASAAFNALSPITSTGDLIIGNGTNSATRLAIGTNGYVLTSNGTTASWAAASGVTSFTAGTTGLTPSSPTTGAITLAGTLNTANGGTGLTGFTAANNAIYSTSSSALTAGTLPVAAGGTGATTLTGVLKGNGTSAFTAATAGTDYVAPGTATTFTATQTFSGSSSVLAAIATNIAEVATVSATAATGTINFDVTTQSVLYYTSSASANWTLNIRGSSGTSLNTLMSTGQSITIAFLVTNGATAYYQTGFTIDGTSVTPKWQGGTAPTSGDASAVDIYTFSIVKTGSAAYTVFGTVTKFA